MQYKLPTVSAKDTKALIQFGSYDYINDSLKEFPFEKTEEIEIELISFNKYISSEDAVKQLDEKGYRPATTTELLILGFQYPGLQRENPIVALGTTLRIDGSRHVAYLYGSTSGRLAGVCGWVFGWFEGWRFAAVRKSEALGARDLGTSDVPLEPLYLEVRVKKLEQDIEKLKKLINF